MRSIGKKNITLVKNEVLRELKKQKSFPFSDVNYGEVETKVIENLPVELWDTWEMADQQIRGIVSEHLSLFAHGVLKI
jgi:hypothetical protein